MKKMDSGFLILLLFFNLLLPFSFGKLSVSLFRALSFTDLQFSD